MNAFRDKPIQKRGAAALFLKSMLARSFRVLLLFFGLALFLQPSFAEELMPANAQSASQESFQEDSPDFNPLWLFPANISFSEEFKGSPFTPVFWEGQEGTLIASLLEEVQFSFDSPALLRSSRDMLLSSWPVGLGDRRHFLALRLQKFYDFGDLPAIRRTLEIFPALLSDPNLGTMRVKRHFALAQPRIACGLFRALQRARGAASESRRDFGEDFQDADFALTNEAVCQFVEGRASSAKIIANLLRERGRGSEFLFAALSELSPEGEAWTGSDHFSSALMALYRASQTPPSPKAIKRAAPALLLDLFRDSSLPLDMRLIAGARSAMRGFVSLEELTLLYKEKFGRHPESQNPESVVFYLTNVFTESAKIGPAVYLSAFRVHADSLKSLRVEEHLGYFLPFALQAFLLFNDSNRLRAWLDLAPSSRRRGAPPIDRFVSYFWERYNESLEFSDPSLLESRQVLRVALHILAPQIVSFRAG